jgi:hypothetical protein
MFDSPHRRLNLLTREWVLVSPHRAKRPWLGQVEKKPASLCPSMIPLVTCVPAMSAPGACAIRLTLAHLSLRMILLRFCPNHRLR